MAKAAGGIWTHGVWFREPIGTQHFSTKVVTMEINGKIIELLTEKSGESANGPWRKQEYILETDGQYPKKVCFMAWGDKLTNLISRKVKTWSSP